MQLDMKRFEVDIHYMMGYESNLPEGLDHRSVVTVDIETAIMKAMASQPHDCQLNHNCFCPANVLAI